LRIALGVAIEANKQGDYTPKILLRRPPTRARVDGAFVWDGMATTTLEDRFFPALVLQHTLLQQILN
jgi:hypothetical protein